jgi:nicotinate dehydrogenase subunit A
MSTPRHLHIDGAMHAVTAPAESVLLDVLRSDVGIVSARFGCGAEACGACMVLIDGTPAYACTRALGTIAATAEITTVEGLGTRAQPHPLQQAFLDVQAGQCGYCLAGILISAKALLDRIPRPTRAEIAAALDGHLCRCGAHDRILRAVALAAQRLAEQRAQA